MNGRYLPLVLVIAAVALTTTACSNATRSSPPSASKDRPSISHPSDTSVEPASPSARVAATAAPPTGTTLLRTQLEGAVNVISNGVGFTVVQDLEDISSRQQLGAITAYDAAGTPEAKVTNVDIACGAADVLLPSKRRVLLAETSTSTPAQGVNPATSSATLNEFDAITGQTLWSTTLVSGPTSENPYDGCNSANTQGQLALTTTSDGAYAVDQVAPAGEAWVIDLTTGAKRASKTAVQALGGVIVDQTQKISDNLGDTTNVITFSDPKTGAQLGAPPGVRDAKDLTNGANYASESELIYTLAPGSSEYDLQALSLPGGTQRWVVKNAPVDVSDVSVVGSVVIGWNHFEDSTGLAGFSLSTGAHLWTQRNAQFCTAANDKVVITVNGQLAVLSASAGNQLSFDASTARCPNVLPNGVRWSYSDTGQQIPARGELTVDQYL